MESIICFSQYFVNKQNVRSFSNIFNKKLLKLENHDKFLRHIFQDDQLISEIPVELIKLLAELRSNIKMYSKQDFKNYFTSLQNKNVGLCPINKIDIFASCWMALCEIVPKIFIGNNHNCKLFRKLTKTIIYSMKWQCIDVSKITEKWHFNVHPWQNVSDSISLRILESILKWIYKYLLASMIVLNFYVNSCKIGADENKLHFFGKSLWQSFYDKTISKMLLIRTINKFKPYCLGKQVKKNFNISHGMQIKKLKKDIPKLHLILKANNEYRPIVHYKKVLLNYTAKCKIKEKFNFLRTLAGPPHERIDTMFASLHSDWVKQNQPKMYFVKTDLSNAFGSINRTKLLKILFERHQKFQKEEQSIHLKQKFAQIYQEFIGELRKPLLIRAGSTIYEWREGLVQGYKYSPALSELYYSYMDELYFVDHLFKAENSLKLFKRIVDDYLYITDSIEDAHNFLLALSNYRNVNYDKTVVNFTHPTIKTSGHITFIGYTYDTVNLHVSRAKNVYVGQMCYKIAFTTAIANVNTFINNRVGQSGIQISSHLFNLNYNREDILWEHIFITLCLSANKFCTIITILCNEEEMIKYLSIYKKRVSVNLCNSIIEVLYKVKSKFNIIYCINHFRYLSFKALILCAKQTSKCNILVPHINAELAKSNCIFGKWRDHSSRINKDGTYHAKALKDVCTRKDLRQIFKNFESLPVGVECFKHYSLYK